MFTSFTFIQFEQNWFWNAPMQFAYTAYVLTFWTAFLRVCLTLRESRYYVMRMIAIGNWCCRSTKKRIYQEVMQLLQFSMSHDENIRAAVELILIDQRAKNLCWPSNFSNTYLRKTPVNHTCLRIYTHPLFGDFNLGSIPPFELIGL